MNKSEQIGQLAAALAKAQGEMSNPSFDSQNPHFKNRYASLAAVRNAVIPALAKHGVSLLQTLHSVEDGIECETMLMHASGEWLSDTLTLPVSKSDSQGYGSAATYARRYSMMAMCGVVGDDDDDANAAASAAPKKPAALTDKQVKDFFTEINSCKTSVEVATLWKKIAAACNAAKDTKAHAELKDEVMRVGTALTAAEGSQDDGNV